MERSTIVQKGGLKREGVEHEKKLKEAMKVKTAEEGYTGERSPSPMKYPTSTLSWRPLKILTSDETVGLAQSKPITDYAREVPFCTSSSHSSSDNSEPSVGEEPVMKAESTLPTTISGVHAAEKESDYEADAIFTDNEALAVPEDTKSQLIHECGETILKGLGGKFDGSYFTTRISKVLPDLLKDFSQELSFDSHHSIQREAAVFVRHYRE